MSESDILNRIDDLRRKLDGLSDIKSKLDDLNNHVRQTERAVGELAEKINSLPYKIKELK